MEKYNKGFSIIICNFITICCFSLLCGDPYFPPPTRGLDILYIEFDSCFITPVILRASSHVISLHLPDINGYS